MERKMRDSSKEIKVIGFANLVVGIGIGFMLAYFYILYRVYVTLDG